MLINSEWSNVHDALHCFLTHKIVIQVSRMGVTSILVYNGVTREARRQGLVEFSQESSSYGTKKTK